MPQSCRLRLNSVIKYRASLSSPVWIFYGFSFAFSYWWWFQAGLITSGIWICRSFLVDIRGRWFTTQQLHRMSNDGHGHMVEHDSDQRNLISWIEHFRQWSELFNGCFQQRRLDVVLGLMVAKVIDDPIGAIRYFRRVTQTFWWATSKSSYGYNRIISLFKREPRTEYNSNSTLHLLLLPSRKQ